MAIRTLSATGGNYASAATWVELAIPTSSDDIVMLPAGASGPLVIAGNNNFCKSIDFTNYTNTCSGAGELLVLGSMTLVSGMTTTYSGILYFRATGTLTSAGKTATTGSLQLDGASGQTTTLADNAIVGSLVGNVGGAVINGNTLTVNGSVNMLANMGSGTTRIIMAATGTLSANGILNNDLDFQNSGTVTCSGNIYAAKKIRWVSGTVVASAATLQIYNNPTLETGSNVVWGTISTQSSNTCTLTADLWCTNLTVSTTGNSFSGLFNLYIGGNLTMTQTLSAGTSPFIMNGTGTWSGSGAIKNNLTFNTSGTITVSGSVSADGTVTYIAGTMVTTGSTLGADGTANPTYNTSGMTWNNWAQRTCILTSNFNCVNLTVTSAGIAGTGFTVSVSGNLTVSSALLSGTASVALTGTGSWTGTSDTTLAVAINTPGTITYSYTGTLRSGASLTYVAGTVVTTSSTLSANQTATLTTNGIVWNNVTFSRDLVTLGSDLNMTGTLSIGTVIASTIAGAFNINNTGSLNVSSINNTGAATINLTGTGSWSGTGRVSNNTNINTTGTITLSGAPVFGLATLTYVSGTVVDNSTTFAFQGDTTCNTNGNTLGTGTTSSSTGMNFNNIGFNNNLILTNTTPMCAINGFNNSISLTLNGSTLYLQGNLTSSGGIVAGSTAKIILNGTGTWAGAGQVCPSIDINTTGLITIGSATWGSAGTTFSYITGSTTCTGTFTWQCSSPASNINVNGSTLENCGPSSNTGVNFLDFATNTGNLGSVTGNMCISRNANLNTNQTWTGGTVYIGGNFIQPGSNSTTLFVLNGSGTWTGGSTFGNNLTFNTSGTYTMTGSLTWNGTKTFTYIKGRLNGAGSTLTISSNYTFVGNLLNCLFDTIIVTGSGFTLTMDSFFQGIPATQTRISSNNTTNYTITFTQTKEQLTKFVKLSNCTLSQPGRLLVRTILGNQGSNSGVRYINSVGNTFPNNLNLAKSPFGGFSGWIKQY